MTEHTMSQNESILKNESIFENDSILENESILKRYENTHDQYERITGRDESTTAQKEHTVSRDETILPQNDRALSRQNDHTPGHEAYTLNQNDLLIFAAYLRERDRSEATVEKYLHDVRELAAYADGRPLTQALAVEWKRDLLERGLSPSTVNCRIAAANAFFRCLDLQIHLGSLRVQRQMFRNEERDLTLSEYHRLVQAARESGDERLALLFETICATGIRVSEVKHITVEAVRAGFARIHLKGKIRTILIPDVLCRKLRIYAKEKKISAGEIFLTKTGRSLSRTQIWAMMKAICTRADVAPEKVYPHNLRHLFARTYYEETHDIAQLADVLGHSSMSTTRIYLISTGKEHRKQLERLRLVC